ncbi:hypothetical protein [Thermoflavifilum aggregans]|nr:hypothetical protein [Thermoflavifilum aggregans]
MAHVDPYWWRPGFLFVIARLISLMAIVVVARLSSPGRKNGKGS